MRCEYLGGPLDGEIREYAEHQTEIYVVGPGNYHLHFYQRATTQNPFFVHRGPVVLLDATPRVWERLFEAGVVAFAGIMTVLSIFHVSSRPRFSTAFRTSSSWQTSSTKSFHRRHVVDAGQVK